MYLIVLFGNQSHSMLLSLGAHKQLHYLFITLLCVTLKLIISAIPSSISIHHTYAVIHDCLHSTFNFALCISSPQFVIIVSQHINVLIMLIFYKANNF